MPIPLEQAFSLLTALETQEFSHLFAQAHAKHVLREVRESPSNFPGFATALDDKVTFAAYGLLAAGCSIMEQQNRGEGAPAVERAASLMEYIHGPSANDSRESRFHVFLAAMAFYAAGQYSRAFVAIRAVEQHTPAAQVVAAFLRKDQQDLINRLNQVLLGPIPLIEDQLQLDEWAITVAISQAVAFASEFTYTGNSEELSRARERLQDASIVAVTGNHPAWWWIVRLLRLMMEDLASTSPWQTLPPYFGPPSRVAVAQYIRLLAFAKPPVIELWTSQRAALPLCLNRDNAGAVVNLRTSSGKTRVAEIAILQTLLADSAARILYLAPFRSLAFEVERTLSSTFAWLGYQVSHLYGGSRVSSVDSELAADSSVIIATPEKARAILRATPGLFENVRLIVVDEGHLIGPTDRNVRNEVFLDHLRSLCRESGARMLLLSAVLPNPQELAEWVAGDPAAVASSTWKPSAERLGFLRWNGSHVRLDWRGEFPSFNPSFVVAKPLGFGRRRKPFPRDKNEAVAATAVRLSEIGPVMIFTGKAKSVPGLAAAVLLALGEKPAPHPWPKHEWMVFESVCAEEMEPNAIVLQAARAGVVCHSNKLTPHVREALEYLMRSMSPRIIIATTTLAQGVNIGVSSVIIASPYMDITRISTRDFWNICGRAGRAFVDGEGKILYALDETKNAEEIRKNEDMAEQYFRGSTGGRVESGLLRVVQILRQLALEASVDFDVLLELAANNDFSSMGSEGDACADLCDLLDDELMALDTDQAVNPESADPSEWVERVFRHSLAAIQARSKASAGVRDDDVIAFLKARATSNFHRVPFQARRAIVTSGLPLSVALTADKNLDIFRRIADAYDAGGHEFSALSSAVESLEKWARTHAAQLAKGMPDSATMDALRGGWLGGIGLRELARIADEINDICRELYGYQLPWIIHAVSQQLRCAGESDRADAFAEIALLVELGVPTDTAARIVLAGVRSRVAATELSSLDVAFGVTVPEIRGKLRDPEFTGHIRSSVSAATAVWLDVIAADNTRLSRPVVPSFAPFRIRGTPHTHTLHARTIGRDLLLSSTDGQTRIRVKPSEDLPFDRVANDPRVAFIRREDTWHAAIRDPRTSIQSHGGDADCSA